MESLDVAPSHRSRFATRLLRAEPALKQGPRVLKPAAVLIPVVERATPTVLFTRRTDCLAAHAGQICFPGGRYNEGDANLTETALREAEEEIGLDRARVEVAGYLNPFESGSGYAILPVVGFVGPDVSLLPNEAEVAEVFEVPLAFLRDRKNHLRRLRERDGELRPYHAISFEHHTIWGLTAALVVQLSERLGET